MKKPSNPNTTDILHFIPIDYPLSPYAIFLMKYSPYPYTTQPAYDYTKTEIHLLLVLQFNVFNEDFPIQKNSFTFVTADNVLFKTKDNPLFTAEYSKLQLTNVMQFRGYKESLHTPSLMLTAEGAVLQHLMRYLSREAPLILLILIICFWKNFYSYIFH